MLSTPPMLDEGLSPRVRGNHSLRISRLCNRRSIPACAGEPITLRLSAAPLWVYPRVCGGTSGRRHRAQRLEGLSPRVRGNPTRMQIARRRRRSIPACAGEPHGIVSGAWTLTVYPRVCGGTKNTLRRRRRSVGLSPRVRGNLGPQIRPSVALRSIPACAGEPTGPLGRRLRATVYPRVCGGTQVAQGAVHNRLGLSPRVRGNQRATGPECRAVRSIPACAGEPGGAGRR